MNVPNIQYNGQNLHIRCLKNGNFAFLYFFFYLPKEKSNISNTLYSRQNLHIIIFENVEHFLISLLLFSPHFFQSIQNRQYSTKICIFQHFEILDICCFISFPSFFSKNVDHTRQIKCAYYELKRSFILLILFHFLRKTEHNK